jgi:hypothetical protein
MSNAFRPVRATINNVRQDIDAMQRELAGISIGAGLLTGMGLKEARSMRQYQITFAQLLGDEQEAAKLMGELTDQANEFGIEVGEVWQLGRALLPVLEDGEETLDEWVKRAAMLSSTNPLKGTRDAVRAIQEYLAGQERSLQFLFNVDPNLIQEAKSQYQDVGEQLDFILRRMGATEEAAREMADTTIALRNELRLLLAEGFMPLLEGMRPIITDFREWLGVMRETHPELLNIGAGLTVLTGAGASSLLILNQVLGVMEKISGLNIAPALGKAGVYGGALAIGTGAGIGISRGLGRVTGREDMQQANLASIFNTLKQATVAAADTWSKASSVISVKLFDIARDWNNAVNQMIAAIGGFIADLGRTLRIGRMEEAGLNLQQRANENIERWNGAIQRFTEDVIQRRRDFVEAVGRFMMPSAFPQEQAMDPRQHQALLSGTGGGGGTGYTQDQLSAIQNWHDQRQQIIEDTEQQINDVTRQYESQRASIVRNFNKRMAREAEDWARQQMRARRELERNIAEVYESRADREAEWAEDLGKRIAEMQEQANRQLQRLQEEHRMSLLDAASRLDARAVADEQRRYKQRRRDIKRELDRSTKEAVEAHEERLEVARDADEERIKDMKDAFKEEQRLAEEDRRIRLQRMKEDHRDQLREMDSQHWRRLNQIQQHGWEERQQLDYEFQQELTQLGLHQDDWLTAQEQGQQESLAAFQDWWDQMAATVGGTDTGGVIGGTDTGGVIGGRQGGGPVATGGLYELHGTRSRPEYVLSADTTRMISGMLGGGFTQGQLVGAVAGAGGGGGANITIHPGAFNIPIHGAPGQSAADIGAEVRRELEDLFRSIIRSAE